MKKNRAKQLLNIVDDSKLLKMHDCDDIQQKNINLLKLMNEKICRFNDLSIGSNAPKNTLEQLNVLEEINELKRQCELILLLQNLSEFVYDDTGQYQNIRSMIKGVLNWESLEEYNQVLKKKFNISRDSSEPLVSLNDSTINLLAPETQALCYKVNQLSKLEIQSTEGLILIQKNRQALLEESLREGISPHALNDIRQARTHLRHKINHLTSNTVQEKDKEKVLDKILSSPLAQGLSTLSAEDHINFTIMLSDLAALQKALSDPKNSSSIKDIEVLMVTKNNEIKEHYPYLNDYEIKVINIGNNINFKLVSNKEGIRTTLLLQLESIDFSMLTTPLLYNSLIRPYLCQDYRMCRPLHDDVSKGINLREFSDTGDIQNEAKKIEGDASKITQSYKRFTDLTSFCQKLHSENAVYTDIKTSNFLIREDDSLFTPDYKSIKFLGSQRKLKTSDVNATYDYFPPEAKIVDAEIDPEKFMIYQIGLAYYEYLVCPELTENWTENLIFDLPVFKNEPEGPLLKKLIESTQAIDPKKRPSLDEFECALSVLKTLSNRPELSELSTFETERNNIGKSQLAFSNAAIELTDFLSNTTTDLDTYISGFHQRNAYLNETFATLIKEQEKAISMYQTLQSLPEEYRQEKKECEENMTNVFKQLNILEEGTSQVTPLMIKKLEKSLEKDKSDLHKLKATLNSKVLTNHLPKEGVETLQKNLQSADFKPRTFIFAFMHFIMSTFNNDYKVKFIDLKSQLQDLKPDTRLPKR